MTTIDYEATHLRGRQYAIKPAGQLGTCGWYPIPWTVQYVIAGSAPEALMKAAKLRAKKTHRRDSMMNLITTRILQKIKINQLSDFDPRETLETLMHLYYGLHEVWKDPNDSEIDCMQQRLRDAIVNLSGYTPDELCKWVAQ